MGRSTFTVFATIFGLSLYFLVAGQAPRARALVAIAVCALGIVRSVRTWIPVWRDELQGRIEFRLWQAAWLLIGPSSCMPTWPRGPCRNGARLSRKSSTPQRFVFTTLFAIALRNSWNLLVEGTAIST